MHLCVWYVYLVEISTIQQRRVQRQFFRLVKPPINLMKEFMKMSVLSGNDNNYYDLAQRLRQSITDMKIKIDRQLRILAVMKDRVKDQVTEMQRLEVLFQLCPFLILSEENVE